MRKIIYVDMDDVLCAYTKAFDNALKLKPAIRFPQSQYGFFRNLAPVTGGIETVKLLDAQNIFDVYILTAPSVYNPLCYTEKRMWIEDHFGFDMVKKLIISPNKGLNKGDYLIDDHEAGRGQENFTGQLLHFGANKYPGWGEVLEYFKVNYHVE